MSPAPAPSDRSRSRGLGPWRVAFIACLWLNQSFGLDAWEKVRYAVFTDPAAHLVDAARYPLIFLYRRSADEAMYYGTAAQILGQPYDRRVVSHHTRGRVPGLAGFDAPPPPADGRWHMPWVEVPLEYSALLLPFVLAPKLVTTEFEPYARVFGLLMGLCMVLAIALAIDLLKRARASKAEIEVRWWLGAGLLLAQGALTIQRLDPVVALLMIAMVRGAARRSPRQLGLLAGLAGACKIVPLLVVPVIVAADWPFWRSRIRRLASMGAWLAAGLGLGFGPMLLASRGALVDLLRYHGARGLQVESTLGVLLGAVRLLCGTSAPATVSYGSFNIDGSVPDLLARLALPITLAGVAALTAIEVRAASFRPWGAGDADGEGGEPAPIARIASAAFGATVLVWLCGKVFSPQYLTWGIPLVLAIPGRRGTVAIWIAGVALSMTQVYYRGYYDFVFHQRFAGVFTVLLRQAVLAGLLVFVTRRPRAEGVT
ncbi:MAG TPA: hypothetical protein VH137_02380 [Gemmatimonadales bacterium]|nr:hypothetical protein [Gemmatimonadales bacterium]